MDPGNLESDLQTGSIAGYKLLWLLLGSHVAGIYSYIDISRYDDDDTYISILGLMMQILSARLGVVTQNHLAQLIRRNYSKPAATIIWMFTQLAIIGSDIQEIIGTAIAIKIIFRLELWLGVLVTASDTFFFMWLQQFGVRKIEAFFITLIGVMIGCFWLEMVISKPSIGMILRGIIVPELPADARVQAVGMVGAVIMPHNMFLHR